MNGALHAQLLRLAARRVGWADAEDVVQAAYLQVWRHREYGPDRLSEPRLLARATLNAARDELRRRARRPSTVQLEPWHGGIGDPEQEALLSIALREAVELARGAPARAGPRARLHGYGDRAASGPEPVRGQIPAPPRPYGAAGTATGGRDLMRTVWVWVATCLACGERAWIDLGGRGFGPHARLDCCPHLEPLLDEWIKARGRKCHEFPRASTTYVVREVV